MTESQIRNNIHNPTYAMRNYNSNILSTKSSPTTAVIASVIPIVATVATVGIARALIKSVRDKKQQELQNCEQQQTQQQPYCVTLSLPKWLVEKLPEYKRGAYESDEARMALAIEISRLNVLHRTGGPFGCVIFKNVNGMFELVSAGLNRVVPLKNSTLHGEMVAIQLAQQHVGCYTLNDGNNMCSYELYTSCEPCCMCLGKYVLMLISSKQFYCIKSLTFVLYL